MAVFNMQGQKVGSQLNVFPLNNEIKKYISIYQRKIVDQEVLEKDLVVRIRRKRGRREDYGPEREELKVTRTMKQCYIQARVDFESLLKGLYEDAQEVA